MESNDSLLFLESPAIEPYRIRRSEWRVLPPSSAHLRPLRRATQRSILRQALDLFVVRTLLASVFRPVDGLGFLRPLLGIHDNAPCDVRRPLQRFISEMGIPHRHLRGLARHQFL